MTEVKPKLPAIIFDADGIKCSHECFDYCMAGNGDVFCRLGLNRPNMLAGPICVETCKATRTAISMKAVQQPGYRDFFERLMRGRREIDHETQG